MTRAKVCVPAGDPFQLNCGETSAPSQVNFLGIAPPAEKLGLVIEKGIVSPLI
jgi:hypothetical protein